MTTPSNDRADAGRKSTPSFLYGLKNFFAFRGLLDDEITGPTQDALKLFGVCAFLTAIPALLKAWHDQHPVGWVYLALIFIGLLSFSRFVPISARTRVMTLAILSYGIALSVNWRQANLIMGFFPTMPAVIMAMLARGTKIAIGTHVLYLAVAAILIEIIQTPPPFGLLASVTVGMMWAMIVLVFIQLVIMQLNRARAELMENQRKQNRVFSIIAHELRTPAAAIKMMSDELPEQELRRDLQVSAEHLLHVVDDMRQVINTKEQIEISDEPFELRQLMSEVEWQVAPLLSDSEMSFRIECRDDFNVTYFADIYRIRAILTNLIRNAYHHSRGSQIILTFKTREIDHNTHRLKITLEDDGIGIPPNQMARLWEPFERGDTEASGTGVGLYIVRAWTERLGGMIDYKASELGGSCFVINLFLPLKTSAPEKDAAGSRDRAARKLKGKSVLLVEDDRLLQRVTARLLEKHFDITIKLASNGIEALEAMAETPIDLIVTDYFMPEMNGRDFIRRVRGDGNETPILALTAATIGEEQEDLIQAGANMVLAKPIDLQRFCEVIQLTL